MFAASAVSLLFGSGTSALTIRRYGSLRLRRLAMIVVVIADIGLIATAALNLGPWALLISIALLTYAVGIILPNAISSAMAYVPQVAGTASGVVGLIQFVTGAISAWMIGLYHPGQTVSYTHLDVYKRQMCRSRRGPSPFLKSNKRNCPPKPRRRSRSPRAWHNRRCP